MAERSSLSCIPGSAFPAHRETHINPLAGKKHVPLTGAVNPIDGIHQGFAARSGSAFVPRDRKDQPA